MEEEKKKAEPYLPQYTLDALADRVGMRIDLFKRWFNPKTIWAGIDVLCRRIEEEPRMVSSVIVDTKMEYGKARAGTDAISYHNVLARVYILLYYRHRDDDPFKTLVFPQLIRNMGDYRKGTLLTDVIQKEVDAIREQEQMVEKALKKTSGGSESASGGLRIEDPRTGIKLTSDEYMKKFFGGWTTGKVDIQGLVSPSFTGLVSNPSLSPVVGGFGSYEINVSDEKTSDADDIPHDKVRLDLLFRLLKNADADFATHGNKKKAAELMRKISGLPLRTCQNYCSDQSLNPDAHPTEVTEINNLLSALGLSVSLSEPTKNDTTAG